MTSIRFEHPEWNAEACTGCGQCYTVCPDVAIPGLVNSPADVLSTAISRVEKDGPVKHLRRSAPSIEKLWKQRLDAADEAVSVTVCLQSAVEELLATTTLAPTEKDVLQDELGRLMDVLGTFKFALTKPYYSLMEKQKAGSGGLFSIVIDPYTCKGCMECVQVCPDDALKPVTQTTDSVQELRKNWEFWLELPNTKPEYVRVDDLEDAIGALESILLDKDVYKSFVGGDGACLGCGEKTVMHLFTSAVQALMQPRVKAHVAMLDDLIARLEKHLRLKLAESVDVSDTSAMDRAMSVLRDKELTLSNLTAALDQNKVTMPLDSEWLKRVTQILAKLKHLRWEYAEGVTGRGRSSMGMINATGCTSVWGSTYPYNPYPFPWANHLFQDATSMAMGVYEGHMAKMADGFRAIRVAELELAGEYDPAKHEEQLRYFDWNDFTDDEFHLCPPVVATGGDGALYDIGFQNLSRMMMSGKPIKVMCLDTQVYSNTGGQACTSGFYGQVSDMAQFGKAIQGKREIRKEIGLIAMAHRTTYVVQGNIANPSHLIEGYIRGLMARRPALFNVHSPCMPEHGIGDDSAKYQSKLALESRAYPIFRYDPDAGISYEECLDLEGNPAVDDLWPTYELAYVDEDDKPASMTLPLTFADYALSEARFRKHFKQAPRDTWNDDMVHIAEFIELSEEDREDKFPYVWAIDRKGRLNRVVVSQPIVRSTEDRRDFWRLLQSMTGLESGVDAGAIAEQARQEVVQKLTQGLFELAGLTNGKNAALAAPAPAPAPAAAVAVATPAAEAASSAPQSQSAGASSVSSDEYVPPFLDSNECTGCGECVLVNPKIFAWNDKKQAFIQDPNGGSYKDLVKAAEKCSARCIKPGLPADRSEKGIEKLIKRAEKFND